MVGGQQEHTVRISTNRYLIYIPLGEAGAAALAECLAYAEQAHPEWDFAGVVAGSWQAAFGMLANGDADVVLVAQRADLPADRLPRIVAVEEELAATPPRDSRRPGGRRPRLS